jgi:hypothetical protein
MVAIAAFLGNAQCFGNCVVAACSTPDSAQQSCHHHKSPASDLAHCSHQHSEFGGPQTDLAKIAAPAVFVIAPAIVADFSVTTPELASLLRFDTGPPPRARLGSSISILRI